MAQLSPSSNSEQVAELVTPNYSTGQKRSNGRLKKLRFILPLGLLLVAAGLGLRYRLTQTDERAIALSGRIESYESDLGSKVGGRVVSLAVREGDEVTQGQVIAKLDDSETRAQLDAAKARVSAAEQQITQAELQIEVVASQV